MKIPIKLIIIGHLRHLLNLKILQRVKSRYFVLETVEYINSLPPPVNKTGYLNVVYSKTEISKILNDINSDGICVGVMNYPFDDHFYMHRVGKNKMCISIADIDHLLLENEISVENFIIKCVYEAVVYYKVFGSVNDDRIYSFVHRDTRGCLFDLNGDTLDVLYNTEKPIICEACKALINKNSLPKDFLKIIERELKNIRKSWIKTLEIFIRRYPLFSLALTIIGTTVINIFSSYLWEWIKIASVCK